MPRLANDEKAGYFPLPDELPARIAALIYSPKQPVRGLDPCIGTGTAMADLARQLNIMPYGIEIHEDRAAMAAERLSMFHTDTGITPIIPGSYTETKISPQAFSLIYNNPPYVFVDDKNLGRAEYAWLRDTRPLLATDGLMIWVVPRHMLNHRRAVGYLASWFRDIQVYKFPDPLYNRFKQIIVFGIRRPHATIGDHEYIEKLRSMGKGEIDIPVLPESAEPMYTLPPNKPGKFEFRSLFVDPEVARAEALDILNTNAELHAMLLPKSENLSFRPLTPLKVGHLTSIISAGLLNNQMLDDGHERLLIKGMSYKRKTTSSSREEKEEGGYRIKTSHTEQFVTTITTLHQDGRVTQLSDQSLAQFLTKWGKQLAQSVADSYPPQYTFDLNGYGTAVSRLNPGRKIPRVGKPGLLPAQAHSAIAAATRLETHSLAGIVGEMGTGKTVMGAAVPALLHSKGTKMNHIIVMCPPHLVKKWQREIKFTWPQAKTTTLNTISDVDRFFAAPGPIFGVIKETTARAGSGWEHAVDYVGPLTLKPRKKREKVIKLTETIATRDTEWFNEHGIRIEEEKRQAFYTGQVPWATRQIQCPSCGHPVLVNGVPAALGAFQSGKKLCVSCKRPLWQNTRNGKTESSAGYARFPIATYINKKYKRRLDMAIFDECHQFKAATSDRGYAYHRIAAAARKNLLLTGTIYGGKASTLFYLLYRVSKEIRDEFTDVTKKGQSRMRIKDWVTRYGVLQEIETESFDEHGKQSGNRRSAPRIKELPGGSPAMYPWLLQNFVFVGLKDMGFALPEYEEIPIGVTMTGDMRIEYNRMEHDLKKEIALRLRHDDKSLLSAYLHALLFYPDAAFRPKEVIDPKGKFITRARGLNPEQIFPKERQVLDIIQDELANHRKVLLLMHQTNTLDITPRWMRLFDDHNIKASVLRTDPNRREAWIRKQVKDNVDVIISHPKRVETGLDLLEFPTIIWLDSEYSVYTLLQASRRSWRIGQDHHVKVYYFAYDDTLQEKALRLVASKVSASLRANGDTIPEDGLAELDELANDDVLTALAKMLTQDAGENDEAYANELMKELNASYKAALKGVKDYSTNPEFYFTDCQTDADIKKKYRQLARKYHPDVYEAPEAPNIETLADAFAAANEAFAHDETVIGDYEAADIPEVEPEPEPEPAFAFDDAPAEEQQRPSVISIMEMLQKRRQQEKSGDTRLVFGVGEVAADKAEQMFARKPAPQPKPEPAPAPAPEPVSFQTVQCSDEDLKHMRFVVSRHLGKKQPVVGPQDFHEFDGIDYFPTDYTSQDGLLLITAYRVAETRERLDLLNDHDVRLREMQSCGAEHGRLIKLTTGEYRILLGPAVTFSQVQPEEAEHAAINALFKHTQPQPAERLVFGVHSSNGRIRDSRTLDRKAAAQMTLF